MKLSKSIQLSIVILIHITEIALATEEYDSNTVQVQNELIIPITKSFQDLNSYSREIVESHSDLAVPIDIFNAQAIERNEFESISDLNGYSPGLFVINTAIPASGVSP